MRKERFEIPACHGSLVFLDACEHVNERRASLGRNRPRSVGRSDPRGRVGCLGDGGEASSCSGKSGTSSCRRDGFHEKPCRLEEKDDEIALGRRVGALVVDFERSDARGHEVAVPAARAPKVLDSVGREAAAEGLEPSARGVYFRKVVRSLLRGLASHCCDGRVLLFQQPPCDKLDRVRRGGPL